MEAYLDVLGNWIDLFVLALVVAGFILGLSQGLVRQGFTLFSLYVSAILALQYYSPVANYAQGLWPQTDPWSRMTLGMATIFIAAFVVLNLVSYSIYQETRLSSIALLDHGGGALAGALEGWILAAIAVNLLGLSFRFVWGGWEDIEAVTQAQFNDAALVPALYAQLPMLFNTVRPWLPAGLPVPFFI